MAISCDGVILHKVKTTGSDEDNDTVSSKADVIGSLVVITGNSLDSVAGDHAAVTGNLSG